METVVHILVGGALILMVLISAMAGGFLLGLLDDTEADH